MTRLTRRAEVSGGRPAGGRPRGLAYVVAAGVLWGLSGTAAQVLFKDHGVEPQWLVTMRLAGSGLLLLVLVRPRFPRRRGRQLLLFSVIGVAGVQYTYFAAIAVSNVATATFLQYSSVAMITAWEVLRGRGALTRSRGAALGACLAGVALLALGGRGGAAELRLEPAGVVLGLLAAVTAALYTLSSVPLVRGVGAWPTTTWGFALGGVPMLFWAPPWAVHPSGSPLRFWGLVAFVVVFGTLFAFGLYLASFRMIAPTQAAITATAEPLSAAVAAWAVLGVALRPLQYVGGAAIVLAVVLLRRETASVDPLPEPPV